MDKVSTKPLIGIPACLRAVDEHGFHQVGHKYVAAVAEAALGVPVVIPALGDRHDIADLVRRLDGLLVTGSLSNVEPRHYDGIPSRPGTLHDPDRDATTLPFIRTAIDHGLPLFAVCRGIQELNVALGGSLYQNLHEVPGLLDHRAPSGVPHDEKYRAAHPVRLAPGGMLADLAAAAGHAAATVPVNTLHAQGIDRLAARLAVEATAPDGLVEAVRVVDAKAFAIGVQWHPEHPVALDWPLSRAMFEAFGAAARARAAGRRPGRSEAPDRHSKIA
jgi:putative glutamine amidotransferase